MVCHVNENFDPKLAYFHKYLSTEKTSKTKYVLGIYNAKCYKLLTSSVFMVRFVNCLSFYFVNDIVEHELSFFIMPFNGKDQ